MLLCRARSADKCVPDGSTKVSEPLRKAYQILSRMTWLQDMLCHTCKCSDTRRTALRAETFVRSFLLMLEFFVRTDLQVFVYMQRYMYVMDGIEMYYPNPVSTITRICARGVSYSILDEPGRYHRCNAESAKCFVDFHHSADIASIVECDSHSSIYGAKMLLWVPSNVSSRL